MPKGVYKRTPEEARFWEKVEVLDEDTACWLWLGAKYVDGYGSFSLNGKSYQAHRYAAATKFGQEAIEGKLVRHTCDKPQCVNPNHLVLGTAADNSADMVARNRQACGEKQHQANLSDAQASEVLIKYAAEKAAGNTYGALERLAKEYSVPKQAIYRITSRKTYRHIVI